MLEARAIYKRFPSRHSKGERLTAVNGVSLTLRKGDFCALVGESGSGKSTLARMLLGMIPPTSGDVLLDGKSIVQSGKRRNNTIFARIQLVLQDGKSALDPRMTIYQSIAEPIHNLTACPKAEIRGRVETLMEEMDLDPALLQRRPSELSGGQQKRVCIARALAAEPEIIIFDEAVSGLDVLVQKNILNLLKRLHSERNVAYLLITHNMDVALYLADYIWVMKDGEIVERVHYTGDTACFHHSYSRLLLKAMTPGT
jgi:nickel transport system ATP-binding protein